MIKDHSLEFCEGHLVLMVDVMLIHDLFNFGRGQLVAELGEGILERSGVDPIVTGDVELAEERVKSLLRSVLLNWERGSDKLVVVDHTCTIDIYLSEDALELLVTQVGVQLLHGLSQLFNLDCAAPISVNFVKLSAKVHKFARVHHLDENVQALASKPVPAMEVLQPD